jgi:hypothetical protein
MFSFETSVGETSSDVLRTAVQWHIYCDLARSRLRSHNLSRIPALPVKLAYIFGDGVWDRVIRRGRALGWRFVDDDEALAAIGMPGQRRFEWDPDELLLQFVNLPDDDDALLRFLQMSGRFEPGTRLQGRPLSYFREWRNFLKRALRLPRSRWQGLSGEFDGWKVDMLCNHSLNLTLGSKDREPATIYARHTLEALLNALHVDRLQGSKWKSCEECNRYFQPRSPRQRFCLRKCMHRAVVRKGRKEAT